MTLHEAMAAVLRERGGWVYRDELARAIAARDLYRQRAGGPAPSDQLRLRAREYPDLFEGSDNAFTRIRLRDEAAAAQRKLPGRSCRIAASAAGETTTTASTTATADLRGARDRGARVSLRYKPGRVRLLLVAEAPPSAVDRYFYFEDVTVHDSLFRYVVRAVLGIEPTRAEKAQLLASLRDHGVFLIDLREDPVDDTPLSNAVPGLVRRAKQLEPQKVILIKVTVYDAAFAPLRDAGLPVVNERVPFPGSGQQRRFLEAFARALASTP